MRIKDLPETQSASPTVDYLVIDRGTSPQTYKIKVGNLLAGQNITVGSINGTPIGNTTPSTGAFTNLTVTGTSTLTGAVGIGGSTLGNASLAIAKNITGGSISFGIRNVGVVQSDVTTIAVGVSDATVTAAAAFTLNSLQHFRADQSALGAGSTVNNQQGFYADSSLIGATSNYGFYGNIPAGTARYNFYANGTAPNRFVGETLVIGPAGLGYGTGAGGTVTQLTSKATAVTINKPCGQIVMFNDSLAAGTEAFFTVNNSLVTATDLVLMTANWNPAAAYSVRVYFTTAGSFNVAVKNNTAGALLDAVLLNFAVIKGATA